MRPVTWACARLTRFSPGCHITGLQPGWAWRFTGNSGRACSKAPVFVPLCLGGSSETWCFSSCGMPNWRGGGEPPAVGLFAEPG
jgi:hypothetical protein